MIIGSKRKSPGASGVMLIAVCVGMKRDKKASGAGEGAFKGIVK